MTGDIALLDDEGFIRITDRLSRFSKIGGEMVPHLKVEEAIAAATDGAPCAVTAIPDEQRGERLAAFYVQPDLPPAALWQRLAATGPAAALAAQARESVPGGIAPHAGNG